MPAVAISRHGESLAALVSTAARLEHRLLQLPCARARLCRDDGCFEDSGWLLGDLGCASSLLLAVWGAMRLRLQQASLPRVMAVGSELARGSLRAGPRPQMNGRVARVTWRDRRPPVPALPAACALVFLPPWHSQPPTLFHGTMHASPARFPAPPRVSSGSAQRGPADDGASTTRGSIWSPGGASRLPTLELELP